MSEVNYYCDGVVAELSVWKGKIYDVLRRIDKAPSGDKSKLSDQVNDLHILVEEIESRLDKLRHECPADWKTDRVDLDSRFANLKGVYNSMHANISPGDIGG